MRLTQQIPIPSVTGRIPVIIRWFGSSEIAKSRCTRAIGGLSGPCDAAPESWGRTMKPISLGACVGQASTAFWVRKTVEAPSSSQIEQAALHEDRVP